MAESPALFDDFTLDSALNSHLWKLSSGNSPTSANTNGTFSPANVDFTTGMMRLTLTQTGGTPTTCVGAEVVSQRKFGYGVYEWVMRCASTSTTPNGVGTSASGMDNGPFSFTNNSQTEIDMEMEGHAGYNTYHLTNWGPGLVSTSIAFVGPDATQAFHTYRYEWSPSQIQFFLDGALIGTINNAVPNVPAPMIVNLWGTNSNTWGGLAVAGTYYAYVKSASYSPFSSFTSGR